MKQLFDAITCKEPGRLVKPVFWNVLANLSGLLPFLCLAHMVDRIYEYYVSGILEPSSLWRAWILMLVSFVITWALENTACKVTYRDGFMASADGRIRLAEHIRKLPLGFLMDRSSGEIGNAMMNDFSRTESAMTHILPQIISGGIMAVIASILLLTMDWRMGLAMFAGFPIALLIMLGMGGLERRLDGQLSRARIRQAGRLQEYLYGMRVIKAYNRTGGPGAGPAAAGQESKTGHRAGAGQESEVGRLSEWEQLKRACTDYRDACMKVEGCIGPLNLVASAFLRSGLSLMTMTGVFLVTGGTLTVPEFALFLLVGTRVFDPLTVALMNYSELMMCGMAGERILSLLEEPKMTGRKDVPDPKNHEIRFDHVNFRYKEQEVLHDVCAVMEPGTMTAVVGPSGSGASVKIRLS